MSVLSGYIGGWNPSRSPALGKSYTTGTGSNFPTVPSYTATPNFPGVSPSPNVPDYTTTPDEQPEPESSQTEGTPEALLLAEIEAEWRQWWREHYGTEYQPGPGEYGRVFLSYLDGLKTANLATLNAVLVTLQGRQEINRQIGQENFITFGGLFFRYVSEEITVQEAKQRAIQEIRKDPVLYVGYAGIEPEEQPKNNTWIWGGGALLLLLLTGKRK